jgi:polyadenylate-binding protein
MWSQRDPTLRKSGAGNIFIKNLDPAIDNKALHDTFAVFGNILSCKVAGEGEKSKGYGFVHFEHLEAAEAAITHVNGMLLNDRIVYVGFHQPKRDRMAVGEEAKVKFTNVYVKNLDESVNDEEFMEMFSKFGKITSAVVSKDENGKSKLFGFVNFENYQDAQNAVEEMNEKEVKGKALFVGRAQSKTERQNELRKQYEKEREEKLSKYQGVNLFIKNLDDTVDDEKLRQEFSNYGVITSTKIMRDDKTGSSRGFGFVCFSSPDEATKAVTETNGKMFAGKPIYVGLAQRKDIRRQQLAVQMHQRAQMRMQQPMMPGMPYPAAPMFYPGQPMPQMQQRGFFPQQGMVPRNRPWSGPGGPQMPQMPAGYAGPGMPGPYPVPGGMNSGMRPQSRPARPAGGNRPIPGSSAGMAMPPNVPAAGRGRGGFKYTPNARNASQGQNANGGESKQVINSAMLASMPMEQQKRFLGENLFHLVQSHSSAQYAGKVTGMLLEMDNAELLHLLESPETLKERVDEAVTAINKAMSEADRKAAGDA